MNATERQRRHDERWQREVLDGMDRMLTVMHDISDAVRKLAETPPTPAAAVETSAVDQPRLLSVGDLAADLGVAEQTIRSMRAGRSGPAATKVGSRIFFQPADVDAWLHEQREQREPRGEESTRPWRSAYLPGRIGSGLPASSEPERRAWCQGSHTEPMAASKYSGRAVCRVCRDDVLVNRDGRLRKHHPRWW